MKPTEINKILIYGVIILLGGTITWYEIKPSFLGAFSLGLISSIIIFFMTGIFIGWVMIDPFQKVKLKRRLTHKEYGIAYIIYHGKTMYPKIIDFSKDIIQIDNKLFHINHNKIAKDTRDYETKVTDKNILYLNHIPIIFINYDSLEPIDITMPSNPEIPSDLGSDLLMWLDDETYKRTIKEKKVQNIILIVIIITTIIIIGGLYLIWSQNSQVIKAVTHGAITTGKVILQNATK